MNWNRPDRPPTRTLEISDRFVLLAREGLGFRSNSRPCRDSSENSHQIFILIQFSLSEIFKPFWIGSHQLTTKPNQFKYGNALSVPTKFFPHRKTKHSFVNTGIFVCLVDLNPEHMFICWCLSTSECKCVTSLPVLINISCKHVLKPHVLIIGTCSTLLQPQISLWSQSICT